MQDLNQHGKLVPKADEIEKRVLGALLLYNKLYKSTPVSLSEDCFFSTANRVVFNEIEDQLEKVGSCDILSVSQRLKKGNKLSEAGGLSYVSSLTSMASTESSFEKDCLILYEFYMLRGIIKTSMTALTSAYEQNDPFEVLEQAQKSLIDLTTSISGAGPIGLTEALKDLNTRIEAGMRGEIKGYKIGLDRYDRITGGWMDGDLVVIAGRPGMGKSAMLGPIIDSAFTQRKKIAIFLLEMPTVQLAARLVSPLVGTSSKSLLLGDTSDEIFSKLNLAYRELCHGSFDEHVYIDDQSTSIRDISVKARRLKARHGLDLIAIDYLQLLSIPGFKGSREQEVASISRSCKMLAKELGLPVVVFAQLSRAVEQTSDKIPTLAHLRESGAIEQDADLVTFLYRPWYYYEQTREPKFQETTDSSGRVIETEKYAAAFIAKHRNGALGTADLGFIPKYAKFTNYEEVYPSLYPGPESNFSRDLVPHPDRYHASGNEVLSFDDE